jgi:hypothetical protein
MGHEIPAFLKHFVKSRGTTSNSDLSFEMIELDYFAQSAQFATFGG